MRHSSNGLIFLPGGMVEPAAYFPLLRTVAEAGYPVHLIELPWRCACVEAQTAGLFDSVNAVLAEPGTNWLLGGHSRGAMLSTRYARESQRLPAGLILIATTHPRDIDLSALRLPVTKILGERDGIATPSEAGANRKLLPASVQWVVLPGANHVQFGAYRHQLGDQEASIPPERQRSLTVAAIIKALGG